MTIRNLDALFKPSSIALIGASGRAGSVGALIARNLGRGGFKGTLDLVNPKGTVCDGRPTLRDIASLPRTPDLAIVCVPVEAVTPTIAQLAARGTRAAVVITAGFGEGGDAAGATRRLAMLRAAKTNMLRVVGPNCLGIMVPPLGIDATFAHRLAPAGDIGFVSQSGAVIAAAIDWAATHGVGFSNVVSLGDMADVDFGDMLDWLALDERTRAIVLHVESITSPRKFMSAARAAARSKPVIVLKAGRSEAAARAAHSHTGALAVADAVYDAAFRRAGMLRIEDLDGLFDAAATLKIARTLRGERLAIMTNGGGLGVLATDALMLFDGRLATLSPDTLARLDIGLPATWSHGNPVDILGDAPPPRYEAALDALLADPGVDAALVISCPTAVTSGEAAADAVVASARRSAKPVLAAWAGGEAQAEGHRRLVAAGLPTYDTPRRAVRGFMDLVQWRRNREALMQTPPALPADFRIDREAARAAIAAARAAGRLDLTEPEAKAVLRACAIDTVDTRSARTPEDAASIATQIGGPVALKILSPDISHKSDVGGVALDLTGADAVLLAARAMHERVARAKPDARLEGFSAQPMAPRLESRELILGLAEDRTFGPIVLFGHGGTAVEVIADRAIGLPPLNLVLARELMGRTRVWRLLQAWRDHAAVDLDALALTLVKVAQIAVDLPEIAELDINPLLAHPGGVLALDARIRLRPGGAVAPGLAVTPYPQHLESETALPDGRLVRLRPIRPEDEPDLIRMVARMDREDVRLRFFAPLNVLSHDFAARLTQIDYDRQMALIAAGANADGSSDPWGVVRLASDPDGARAEFAVAVRSDMKGAGLGTLLMKRIIAYARDRGLRRVEGLVLRENAPMLTLAKRLGFVVQPRSGEPSAVLVALEL